MLSTGVSVCGEFVSSLQSIQVGAWRTERRGAASKIRVVLLFCASILGVFVKPKGGQCQPCCPRQEPHRSPRSPAAAAGGPTGTARSLPLAASSAEHSPRSFQRWKKVKGWAHGPEML